MRGEDTANLELAASSVSKLDAFVLDRELSKIVSLKVVDALEKLSPGLGSDYQLEIEALIDAAILSSTILKNVPTPGMRLNNLMYGSTTSSRGIINQVATKIKILYIVSTVLGTWSWSRLKEKCNRERWSTSNGGWKRSVSKIIKLIDQGMSLLIALNMIIFLQYGNYRNIIERLLRMKLVPIRERAQNPVQFANQNLQLMSSTLSEVMFFIIPLVNWTRLRVMTYFLTSFVLRHGTRFVRFVKTYAVKYYKSFILDTSSSNDDNNSKSNSTDETEDRDMMCCAICGVSSVVMEHRGTQCDHRFCYVCVFRCVSECEQTGISAKCPRCYCVLTNVSRFCSRGDDDLRDREREKKESDRDVENHVIQTS